MKKIPHSLLIGLSVLAMAATANAQIASDVASNYTSGWTNGSTGGTGFNPWSFSNNDDGSTLFAGGFLGDSTAGAGDINTSGESFGIYANPGGAFMDADRTFSSALTVGDTFSAKIALNFDNGNKGFNLYSGGVAGDQLLNFNVGGGGSLTSPVGLTVTAVTATYDYGGNDSVIDLSVTYTDSSTLTYSISRTSSEGTQGVLFDGTLTGTFSAPDAFRFYVSGTDNGDAQNNLYFNNLSIVPEPSTYALFGLGAVVFGVHLLRRRLRTT